MDIVDSKTNKELIESVIVEAAKAQNELRCAKGDVEKATNRLKFVTMLAHKLIERQGD